MTRLEAESFAGVAFMTRSLREEETARVAVLECAARVGSSRRRSVTERPCLRMHAGHLWNGALCRQPDFLARKIRERILSVGISCAIAVSANYYAALCAARAGKGIEALPIGHEAASLTHLPLGVLDLTPTQQDTFTIWGIRTLGSLAVLPEIELISRMGQEGSQLRAIARGEQSHFLSACRDYIQIQGSYEFDQPIEILDSLLFVVSPMLIF